MSLAREQRNVKGVLHAFDKVLEDVKVFIVIGAALKDL